MSDLKTIADCGHDQYFHDIVPGYVRIFSVVIGSNGRRRPGAIKHRICLGFMKSSTAISMARQICAMYNNKLTVNAPVFIKDPKWQL